MLQCSLLTCIPVLLHSGLQPSRCLSNAGLATAAGDVIHEWDMSPSGSQPPRIYSLLRIHKDGISLKPTVPCIGAPSYQLSKHISSLISSMTDKTALHVKNSIQALRTSSIRPENWRRWSASQLRHVLPVYQHSCRWSCLSHSWQTVTRQDIGWQNNSLSWQGCRAARDVSEVNVLHPWGRVLQAKKRNSNGHSPVSAVVADMYMEFFEELAFRTAITTGQNNLQKEEHHLTRDLRQNEYPSAFIHSSSTPPRWDVEANKTPPLEEEHRPPLVMLPYTEGVSEDVTWVCRKFGMEVVFRSGQSLHSMLTKVKYPLMMEKQAKVVYCIPCSCGKAYIGETIRRLETRVKFLTASMTALDEMQGYI